MVDLPVEATACDDALNMCKMVESNLALVYAERENVSNAVGKKNKWTLLFAKHERNVRKEA